MGGRYARRRAHCHCDPVRHRASRGRLAARARRGGRRRALRAEVPRRGAGAEGARRRGGGRRARTRARVPGAGARRDRARPGDRPSGARPGDPGSAARERGREPRRGLPTGLAALLAGCRPRSGRRVRGGCRLARRPRHQHRPHAPEPQPARVAPPHLADRSRGGALLAPQQRPRRSSRRSVRSGAGSCALAVRRLDRSTPMPGSRRGSRRRCSTRSPLPYRRNGSMGCPPPSTPTT